MLAAIVGTVIAGPFEDAVAAYKKGDYATALQLFRPLADDGREDAQYYLAFMYYNAMAVPQDLTEAAKWFRLAAEQGRADAQYSIGSMYLNGQGVTQDIVLAYMWFDLSATQETQNAVTARNYAAQKMTPTQIAEAQKLVREWRPIPHREIVDIHRFPWSSLGKVGTGDMVCTGAVIGPSQFLTAAHCIYNEKTARFRLAGSIHFLLGYEKGEYRVHRVASRYVIPPAFNPSQYANSPDPQKNQILARNDWAIVFVDEPFPTEIKPLRLANETPSAGTAVKIAGYPAERLHMMAADPHCQIARTSPDKKLFFDDCVTHHGDSGAPVLSRDAESLVFGVHITGRSQFVGLRQQSNKEAVAVSAATISEFLKSQSATAPSQTVQ